MKSQGPMEYIENNYMISSLYSEMYSEKSKFSFWLSFSFDMNIVLVYNEIMKSWIPEEIKEFRSRLDLYQKDFAEMIGVTERYVIYLEKGVVRQPSKTLKILLSIMEGQQNEKRKEKKKSE